MAGFVLDPRTHVARVLTSIVRWRLNERYAHVNAS